MIGTAFQQEILKRLSGLGAVYVVGGAVRDGQLGVPSKDVDAVAALSLPEIEMKLSNWGYTPHVIGANQQTVSLFRGTERLDIAAFSGEVETDALRRDFTLNAIYQDVRTGEIKDPLNGLDDLQARRVKACGSAADRFKEDPLRVLRLVRLAVRYGFDIESETWKAAVDHVPQIRKVSLERITEELGRILILDEIDKALGFLDELGYFQTYIPELARLKGLEQNRCPKINAWEHTRQVVKNTPSRVLLRLAALFLNLGEWETAEGKRHFFRYEQESARIVKEIMPRFRWSVVLPGGRHGERELHFLVEHHMVGTLTFMSELKDEGDDSIVSHKARRFAWEIGWSGQNFDTQRVENLLALWRADFLGGEQDSAKNLERFDWIQGEIRNACTFVKERAGQLDWANFAEFVQGKGLCGERFGQFKEQVRRRVMTDTKYTLTDLQFIEQEYELFQNKRK
ncbi:MAG: CCA tRNA nucleotidyltransferase [Desulfosporosinus sp.]|nr:CCA tRNA nucleotidyltransferase [Desulfosporosinus sp.]